MSKKLRKCKRILCNVKFKPSREWHIYCSSMCRRLVWEDSHPRVKI